MMITSVPDLLGDGIPIAFGLTLISDQAASIGATAIQSPMFTDADWFAYQQTYLPPFGFSNEYRETLKTVDSKAKRKVHGETKTLAFVISNSSFADSLEFTLQSKILYMLA